MLKSRSLVSEFPFLDALNRPVLYICPTNICTLKYLKLPIFFLNS